MGIEWPPLRGRSPGARDVEGRGGRVSAGEFSPVAVRLTCILRMHDIHTKGSNVALDAVFTLKVDTKLREEFMAEAAREHRPASQVVRALMREYVERQRQDREYRAFLESKVSAARVSLRRGEGVEDADVGALDSMSVDPA